MINGHRMPWQTGTLEGAGVRESVRRLRELAGIFRDRAALGALDPDTIVYSVRSWMPVPGGTPGGLFWGVTTLAPGKVGAEYFMTHGHAHEISDRAEFYSTLDGTGALILMDSTGRTWMETMEPGSLHYVAGGLAHRVANTGSRPLIFAACWPSDAGHDYGTIRDYGFGARLLEVDGRPVLVDGVRDAGARH